MARQFPYVTDYMTTTQSRSLRLTLADFLPLSSEFLRTPHHVRLRSAPLSPTHHFVHFLHVLPSSLLLPDGTDSLHSPGPLFTRRMWAGGSVAFVQDIPLKGHPFHCTESIVDVRVKGNEGEEKIFVSVERDIFRGAYPGQIKRQLDSGLHIPDRRTLVFMRDNHQEGSPTVSESSSKVLEPTVTPDFSHTMVPTRELLFRFSALTLNAHAIHLDKQFCREVEGHRNLLVHGPLTVVLMIEVLQTYLYALVNVDRFSIQGPSKSEKITHVEYTNLAPLYAEEEMRICVKRRKKQIDLLPGGFSNWDVWIEGRDGGYAVKGTVKTVNINVDNNKPFIRWKLKKGASGRGIAVEKGDLAGESIPVEHVALQNAIKAGNEIASTEDGSLEEDFAEEETTKREAKGMMERETETGAEEETKEPPAP